MTTDTIKIKISGSLLLLFLHPTPRPLSNDYGRALITVFENIASSSQWFQEKLYIKRAPQFPLCNRAASKENAQTGLRPDLLTYQDGHFCSKQKSA